MESISVIIPVFNTEAFLRRCVDSVLGQTLKPMEVILVDDGSTDGSSALCDSFAREHPTMMRVFHQDNRGAAAARNVGIDQAKGSILSFVDSDDYLDPEMYETLFRVMIHEKADVVTCEMSIETPGQPPYYRVCEKDSMRCWDTEHALVQLCSYRYLYTSFCNALFSRASIGALRFPEGKRCEDYALLYRVFACSKKVAYVSNPFYHYEQRGDSCSRTSFISLEPMEISVQQLAFFRENFPSIAWAAETDCVFAHMGVYTAYVRNRVQCSKELRNHLQGTCRIYLKSVLKNAMIPKIKKIQATTFCFLPGIYKLVVERRPHR